uniref:Nucleoporin NUP42 n=1 Tax=Musca domestica TaxID=7370 RepID=A0A1I8NAD9_MUSDO
MFSFFFLGGWMNWGNVLVLELIAEMVLCKFFQQGTCRYGSKCHKEHIDIRQIVKTDIESALNGKQWPLSCYGPFKDKIGIPNFIEDQLFEEVRLLCYEAKQNNYFDQFHQQFNKEIIDANSKMKALLQMTPEILDIVMNCYDSTVGNNVSQPIGVFESGATSEVPVFGKSPSTSFVQNNNMISANNGGNIFGFGKTNAPNVFEGSSSMNQPQSSIFGQTSKVGNSIFGGSTSVFGQQQTSLAMNSNIFSQQTSGTGTFPHQSNVPQQHSPFLPAQGGSNIFNQSGPSPQSPNIFTQGTVHRQTQGVFALPSTQAAQLTSQNTVEFGQSVSQNMPQNLFTQCGPQHFIQNAPTEPSNVFKQPQFNHVSDQSINQSKTRNGIAANSLYSLMKDLAQDEIEAFKAEFFLPGKLPLNPPPKELVDV